MDVLLYFAVSYSCVGVLTGVLWAATRTKAASRHMSYPVLILPWLLPLLPYAAVECQTVACRSILLPATRAGLREIGFSDRVIFFRVMLLTPGAAKVYVVTPCMPHGARPTRYRAVVLRLIREARTWCSAQSETDVWSDCGSANGNVFPPYWGKGDYN